MPDSRALAALLNNLRLAPTFPGSRLPHDSHIPAAPPYAPEVREASRVEAARDMRMRRAQMHSEPMRFWGVVAPGVNVPFYAVAYSYIAQTSQIITSAYLKLKIQNGISLSIAAALSKIANPAAIATGGGGDTSILERWDLFATDLVGEFTLPRGQDSPQNFYLNTGEGVYFLIAGTVSALAPGANVGGNAALYYQITERQAV